MAAPKCSSVALGLLLTVLLLAPTTSAEDLIAVPGEGEDVFIAPQPGAAAGTPFGEAMKGAHASLQEKLEQAQAKQGQEDNQPAVGTFGPDHDKGEQKDEHKPGEEGKKEGKADEEKKPEEPSTSIQRPTTPPKPPDPEELKVRPDESGEVHFSFTGQPWPNVLQWLADVSKLSLDWQELPGDYLNLTTQRGYTLDEARDLINRHLLARGYTLLKQGEVLSAVKLDKLNPAMVPRVQPAELANREPYEFVKVSFPLDWLMAEAAVAELKPMLSPHGTLTALTATNRVEAVDAVANLRQIYQVLVEEQSSDGTDNLMRQFVLKHTRASEVREQLLALLGMEEKKPEPPMSPQQMEQMRRQAEEMARRQAQQGNQPAPAAKPKEVISLVANQRTNSILAHAPPDKMAIIAQAIEAIDVPSDREGSMLATMTRMQVYRLEAIDAAPVVKTLEDLGGLDPTTRLEIDAKNNAIVAYASLADHVTILAMVEKLDGGGRHAEVIQLTDLRAESVAQSIDFMMGGGRDEPQQEQDSGRDGYSSPFGYYRRGSSSSRSRERQEEQHEDRFRVDADPKNNTLLLWCNDFELKKVLQLLDNLRNVPKTAPETNTVRVHRLVTIDPEPVVKTLEAMETLDFHTKLEVDTDNKAIVAYASETDHEKIRELIETLDGSGRKFEVIQLRRLEADYVAGTIQFMMSRAQDESPILDRYAYYPYSNRKRSEEGQAEDQFRVDADVEFNRLLLYANDVELEEVRNLLVKLGEIPPEDGDPSTIRVLGSLPPEETERLLEQLRRAWPSVAPNPLIMPEPDESKQPPRQPQPEEEPKPAEQTDGKTAAGNHDGRSRRSFVQLTELPLTEPPLVRFRLTQTVDEGAADQPPADPGPTEAAADPTKAAAPEPPTVAERPDDDSAAVAAAPPPVTITLTPDGLLMITSEDTKALDRLEELLDHLVPEREDYKVFTLQYAEAYWVALTLKEFFKEEEKNDSSRRGYDYYWWGYSPPSDTTETPNRLSRRRPLKFISDDTTNTILVQGADPGQLKTIEELITLYDQRESTDSESARKTEVFQVRYSKASVIAETIKDVYRDLLSANDKALMNQNNQQRPERSYTYIFGDETGDERMAPKFKGYLSVGIDELSNSLVVSAPEFLFDDVAAIIQALDQVAEPTADTIRVHKLSQSVDITELQKKLGLLLQESTTGRTAQEPSAKSQQREKNGNRNPFAGAD